jgi:hypothetical protein
MGRPPLVIGPIFRHAASAGAICPPGSEGTAASGHLPVALTGAGLPLRPVLNSRLAPAPRSRRGIQTLAGAVRRLSAMVTGR